MRPLRPAVAALLLALCGPALAQDEVELLDLGNGLLGNAYFSPYEDLDRKVLWVLDQAQPGSTVYMSYYSLSYHEYPKKYKQLAERGVRVRLNLFEGELEGTGKQSSVDDMLGKGSSLQLSGKLDQAGDTDWYAVDLEGGVEYELLASGEVRTRLRLIGGDGATEVARSGPEAKATIVSARAPASGTFYVEVAGDTAQDQGKYQLVVRARSYRGNPRGVQVQGEPGSGAQAAFKLDLRQPETDVARVPNTRNPLAYASMHTKFTVVNEEWVITGSANLSASASLANHEHVIIIKDKQLAQEFLAEFEEERRVAEAMHAAMNEEEWGAYYSSKVFPGDWNSGRGQGLDGRIKSLDQPVKSSLPLLNTGFSPEDRNDLRSWKAIKNAQQSIYISMYSFVNDWIAKAVVEKARQGLEVIVIADDHQQMLEQAEPTNALLSSEPKVRFLRVNNHLGNFSSLHHKCAVIDRELVIGGSYNWTSNATRYNDENMTVVRSKVLAERFLIDFAALLAKYDPQGPNIEVAVPGTDTRVLFALAYGSLPNGYELVIVGDAPELGNGDPSKGLVLRGSRSVEPNWLGSANLPRGKTVKWRAVLRKRGSFSGVIEGENAWSEQGAPHELAVRADGVPMIVEEPWQGQKPDVN